MNPARSFRSSYVAAFLLGALFALLLARPARSAEQFRLDRIGIVRFTAEFDGTLRRQHGVLFVDGRVQPRGSFIVPRPANTSEWALNRMLVSDTAWQAYLALGTGAVSQFKLLEGGVRAQIGNEAFYAIAPDDEASPASGRVINLSAQLRISPGAPGIAGFVVDDQPRTVLIRAVGPTLGRFGISTFAGDPFLSVQRNGQTLYFNNDWRDAYERNAIRDAATRVGAFPLDEGSLDAARLLILPPGAYTVMIDRGNPASDGGDVLLEIYSVPPDVVEIFDGDRLTPR